MLRGERSVWYNEDLLYWGYLLYIFVILGWRMLLVILKFLLNRGWLNWGFIVFNYKFCFWFIDVWKS